MTKLNEPLCEPSFPAEELIGPAHERERGCGRLEAIVVGCR